MDVDLDNYYKILMMTIMMMMMMMIIAVTQSIFKPGPPAFAWK